MRFQGAALLPFGIMFT